jgi:hypothetical protein
MNDLDRVSSSETYFHSEEYTQTLLAKYSRSSYFTGEKKGYPLSSSSNSALISSEMMGIEYEDRIFAQTTKLLTYVALQ